LAEVDRHVRINTSQLRRDIKSISKKGFQRKEENWGFIDTKCSTLLVGEFHHFIIPARWDIIILCMSI